ncbi:MAG TPA: PAS domain S-box protein [Anaerolineales bacterium]|nr:PAS domain S-box protein [Anaerolineales bacterium]
MNHNNFKIWDALQTLFTSPFESENQQIERLLTIYLWVFMAAITIGCSILIGLSPEQAFRPLSVIILGNALYLIFYAFLKRGYVKLATILTISITWLLLTGTVLTGGGVHSAGYTGYFILTFLTGITLGGRSMLLVAIVSFISGLGMEYLETIGLLPDVRYQFTPFQFSIIQGVLLILLVLLQYYASRLIKQALGKAQVELNERRQTEQALLASQKRFKAIFESSPIPTAIMETVNCKLLDVNSIWFKLCGHTREELLGKNGLELRLWAMADDIAQIKTFLDEPEEFHEFETILLRKDEEIRNVSVTVGKVIIDDMDCLILQVLDITEKRTLEHSLIESNERFDQITKHIHEVFWVSDQVGKINYASPAFDFIFGIPVEDLYQSHKDFIEFVYPEDRHIVLTSYEYDLRGENSQLEFRIVRPNGEIRWVSDRSYPILNVAGTLIRTVGITTDITEQKRAEMELEIRQKLLEKVIHAGKNVTSITDLDSCLQEIHRNITLNLGFERVGLFLYDAKKYTVQGTYGSDRAGQMINNNRYFEQIHDQSDWQVVLQDPSGILVLSDYGQERNPPLGSEMYGVKQHITLAAWAGDTPVALISVDNLLTNKPITTADIEALQLFAGYAGLAIKNARMHSNLENLVAERTNELRQSQNSLQIFLDTANDLIQSLDETGRYIYVNQAWCRTLGYTFDEAQELNMLQVVDQTYQEHCLKIFRELMIDGTSQIIEVGFRTKQGQLVIVEGSISVNTGKDGQRVTNGFFRDITVRRQADIAMRRANLEMEKTLRMKDEFLANMSHELRTPLNAILGLSESLLEETIGPVNLRQKKYINTISESGRHLLELINDILDLAKIESGQVQLDISEVDIEKVCRASLRIVEHLAKKKNQKTHLKITPEAGWIQADERRLRQMIVNLLSNAVKFTPDQGEVGINAHVDVSGGLLQVEVWDTGIGIQEKDIEHLFQPFVQLDAGLSRESSGTGLGLALVAQMARLHGGHISVSSEIGKGSRFILILPLMFKSA